MTQQLFHRYILNCHELYETPQCVWVVMEVIRGGELLDLLIDGGVYTEKDAARCMKQVFLAISYLHSQVRRTGRRAHVGDAEKRASTRDGRVLSTVTSSCRICCSLRKTATQTSRCLSCSKFSVLSGSGRDLSSFVFLISFSQQGDRSREQHRC